MTTEWCCYFCYCESETKTSFTNAFKSSTKPQIYFTRKIKPLPLTQYIAEVSTTPVESLIYGRMTMKAHPSPPPPPLLNNFEEIKSQPNNIFEKVLIILLLFAVFVLISLSIFAYKLSKRKTKIPNNDIEMSDFSISRDKDNTVYRSLTHDKSRNKRKENNKQMADINRMKESFSQPQCSPSIINTNDINNSDTSKQSEIKTGQLSNETAEEYEAKSNQKKSVFNSKEKKKCSIDSANV